jgi:hypothetical protein
MRKTLEAQIADILAAQQRPSRGGVGNDIERKFAALIESGGGTPVGPKIGWPDYAVFGKDAHLKAIVEVKPDGGRWAPRVNQVVMLTGLASFEVPSFVWSPSTVVKVSKDGIPKAVSMDSLIDLL